MRSTNATFLHVTITSDIIHRLWRAVWHGLRTSVHYSQNMVYRVAISGVRVPFDGRENIQCMRDWCYHFLRKDSEDLDVCRCRLAAPVGIIGSQINLYEPRR